MIGIGSDVAGSGPGKMRVRLKIAWRGEVEVSYIQGASTATLLHYAFCIMQSAFMFLLHPLSELP